MSGGSWDYISYKFDECAERLKEDKDIKRRALGRKVKDMADALHAIEWNDSGDGADEVTPIIKCLGKDGRKEVLEIAIEDAKKILSELNSAILEAKEAFNK